MANSFSSKSTRSSIIETPEPRDWRCTRCDKLLGLRHGDRVHLRFSRGHEYLVGFPVTSTCRGCGTLNEL